MSPEYLRRLCALHALLGRATVYRRVGQYARCFRCLNAAVRVFQPGKNNNYE